MQQNMHYSMGYYAPPPPPPPSGFDPPPAMPPPAAPDYAPIAYGSPAAVPMPAPVPSPSGDAVYAQNSADSSYYAPNHPYAPQAPSIPFADPSFSSPNASYNPHSSFYGALPQAQSSVDASYGGSFDRSYDYSGALLPNPSSTPPTLSQPYGANPNLQRDGVFQDGYQHTAAGNSSQISCYADHSSRSFMPGSSSGYDVNKATINSSQISSYADHSSAGRSSMPGISSGYEANTALVNSLRISSYADRGGESFMPGNSSGYEANNSVYLQGRGYEKLGFDHPEAATYDNGLQDNFNYSDVYPYDGGKAEPYGARGSKSVAKVSSIYNPLSVSANNAKIARASPKSDPDTGGNGVQKYRVKLLPESSSSDPPTDVLCQIGLDGVRMLVPSTSKLLRIYPLETITKWKVSDSSTFTFWAKTIVDAEERRIRLQSSSYTVSAILDTLTAACVQLCEMVDKETPSDSSKGSSSTSSSTEPGAQKKSSFVEWVTLKPKSSSQEEKQHWVPDEAVKKCTACAADFGAFVRRHHCRNCGDIFCDKCTRGRTPLNADQDVQPVRVCDRCLAEVTQRLTNMDLTSKPAVQRCHEDLAKKLQEEMEKNAAKKLTSRSSGNLGSFNARSIHSGSSDSSAIRGPPHLWSTQSTSEGLGPRMREVECPTCTVHLQVQLPSFGSETVECGVCQHPFLVNAH